MAKHSDKQRGPRPPSQRQLRVGEELRHLLADILERGDFRDPALAGANLTVTAVDASPDLRNATVFVVPLGRGVSLDAEAAGSDGIGEVIKALNHAAPFIRRQVAGKMRMKFLPAFTFRLDDSFDHASHIEALLHDPRVARDLNDGDDGDGGDA
ncbi:MAG: 30S ribosome-binding factor RbfA [Rhodospirillaceae bacterium]